MTALEELTFAFNTALALAVESVRSPEAEAHFIRALGLALGEPGRSQKLRDAGFTARDTRLTCEECSEKVTAQMLPIHSCRQQLSDTVKWCSSCGEGVSRATGCRATGRHDLYATSDADKPEEICDRNGEVVLSQCRVCGRAEAELDTPCLFKEITEEE